MDSFRQAADEERAAMIGVAAPESRQGVVAEFFELFKTPWEWVRPGRAYDVLLCAGEAIPDNEAHFILVFCGGDHAADEVLGVRIARTVSNATIHSPAGSIPLLGVAVVFAGSANGGVPDEVSGEPLGAPICWAGRRGLRLGYDLFDEVERLRAGGQPVAHAAVPSLDRHIALLRDWILGAGLPVVEIPPMPPGFPFTVCLTHDIDHPVFRNHRADHTMVGFFLRATLGVVLDLCRGRRASLAVLGRNWRAALAAPLVHFGLLADPWRRALTAYGRIERGLASTYFAIPFRGRPGRPRPGSDATPARRGAGYDLSEIESELRSLAAGGAEVGVHGIDGWTDADAGRAEAARVVGLAGRPDLGIRMHWLYFDPGRSPGILEQAGFVYDSTCGYNETVGFRAGTAQVFRPPGATRLLELPLILMDTALFYLSYLDLPEPKAKSVVRDLVRHLAGAGGVLTVNWHDRSVAPERCWDRFYEWLLAELKSAGAWFVTARQAVAWFEGRRSLQFTDVRRTEREISVRVTSVAKVSVPLGAYRLRVHRPARAEADANPAAGCLDLPLGSGEISVAV